MTKRVPWKLAIAIFMVSALTNSLSIANAESTIGAQSDQHELLEKTLTVDNKDGLSIKKTFNVNLYESIGVADVQSGTGQNRDSSVSGKSVTTVQVNLSEKMSLALDDNHGNNLIPIVKRNSEFQATFDRIWNFDRIRIHGKEITNTVASNDQSYEINLVNSIQNQEIVFTNTIRNFENELKESISVQLIGNLGKNISVHLPDGLQIISGGTIVGNEVWKFIHDTVNPKDPIVFLLLVPISGYILVKTENDKIQIYNPRKILSLFFMFIIISSAIATPVSLSPSFIAAAYATGSNQTVDTTTNDTTNNGTNSLSFNQFSNATEENNSLSFSKFSNATNSLSFNNFSNATSIKSNSTLSFNNFSNATSFNSTSNIPPAAQSWQFNQTTLNSTSVGNTELDNSTGTPSLQLNGDGYLKQNGTSTANLLAFTLSAWVKPDYSQGSSQFTVVSKSNTFLLAVNNNMPPANKAVFSIFDGIRWNTVTSNSTIPQDWTHLVATFNGTTIALFVNGKLESSQQVSGVPTVAFNGQLQTKTVDNLSSNADVLIGAYIGSRETPSNLFSGLIEGVQLYGSLLSPAQISQIYQNNSLSQNSQTGNTVSNSTKPVNLPTNSTLVQKPSINNTLSFNQFSNATAILNSTSILNATLTNSTSANDTAIPVTASLVDTKSNYLITESPEFKFEYLKAADLKKFKKDIKESAGPVQQGGWTGTNDKIKIDVIGPDGSKIPLKSVFQKLRDGKFDIKLNSLKHTRPGLYKVTITLTRNGQTYTTQDQFYWGLVSANTQKSIYKPGDTANFVIVVLDNGGHSVCNSNISMKIIDPSGNTRTLSTGNGITAEQECGLYDASYVTTSEGNYTVGISATNPSGTATFNTSFLAKNLYPFDIIRTADSKIDPIDNPNLFHVKLDVTSFTNASSVTIRETVPSVFNVTTDGVTQTVGDTITITWSKNLIGNHTSVQYTYSVPLQYPQLYALGQAQITYDSGKIFNEARSWFVAVDPGVSIALSPNTGAVGTSVSVTGSGFGNSATVTITYQASTTITVASCTTTNKGVLNPCTFTVPSSTAGSHTVTATQGPNHPTATFTVTSSISLSPTTGAVGSSVTVDGTGMGATKTITIKYDSVTQTTTPSSCTSDANGGFSCTFTVPASTSGSHTVTASDLTNSPSATFIAFNVYTSSLPETFSASDTPLSRIPTITLPETFSASDTPLSRIPTITLPETFSASDTLSKAQTITLQDTFTASDVVLTNPPTIDILSVGTATSGLVSSSSFTISGVTVPSYATNTELVLSITLSSGTVSTGPSAPTWSGGGCTFIPGPRQTNTIDAELWYCKNPTAANGGTITVHTSSGTAQYVANVYVLSGVDLSLNPTAYTSASGSTGTSMSQTISQSPSLYYNIDTFAINNGDGSVVAPTSSNNENLGWIPLSPSVSLTGASSYQNPPGTSMGYTWSTSGAKWAWVALAVPRAGVSSTKTLSETFSASDELLKGQIQTLPETLSSTDAVSNIPALSLSETLSSTDAVTRIPTVSLSETLSSSDTVSNTPSILLSETLSSSDAISKAPALILQDTLSSTDAASGSLAISLSETLSSSDAISKAPALILQDTLSSTDTVSNTPSILLSETLSSSDAISKAQSLTLQDTLSSTDTTSRYPTVSLSETLSSSDTVSKTTTKTLQDTFSSTDTTNKVITKTLQEAVGSSDAIGKGSTATLQDTLSSSDTVSKTTTKTLQDTFSSTDVVAKSFLNTQNLAETFASADSIVLKGGIKIEARDQNNALVPGATYSISPNPNGGNTPLIVVDGRTNDADGNNNGRSVVTLVPLGPYNITMTTIPATYNVLGNYTIYTVSPTNLNGIAMFRVTPVSTNLSTLPPTVITSAPNLNDTVLDTWVSSFNAHSHNGTQPITQITAVPQLPPIISAGKSDSSAISTAINNQATVQLETNFTPQADPATIIQTLGVPVYSVPKSSDVVSVIPSIVAQSSNLNVPTQTVTTPPLDKIVPGQQMIVPVNPAVIPNTGGLKQLDVTSSSSATSSTGASSDWFVVKVDNTIPNTIKSLSSSGITDKPTLYINVTYQWEATNPHTGFDWSNPANFAHPPQLTLQLPKPSASSGIKTDTNGCPVSDIFLYDPSTGSWTTNTVTVISANPTVGNPSTCDVVVQAHHFSQFALGSPSVGGTSTSSGSTGAGVGTGGAAGSVGTGPSGVGASTASSEEGFGGVLAPELKIDNISYDVCQSNTVKILVEYSDNNPSVILRTSLTGIVQTQLAKDQPFAQENLNSTIQKIVYEAPINPKEQSFEVVALQAVDNNVNSVGQTVDITGCQESINFENGQQVEPSSTDVSAPKIFDVKLQSTNGTVISGNNYVGSQSVTVSAIISSPTPLDKAEIRFMNAEQSGSIYNSATMTVAPLLISNTTYTVTGTIPQEMLASPATTYWVDVHNTAQKTTDSDKYTVAVKPPYLVSGNLTMDITPTRAAGTMESATAYFANNSTGPVYGSISLVVDGNVVYTSPQQLFATGQTPVNLEWQVPTSSAIKDHQINAIANFYGQSFKTETSPVISFQSIRTVAISTPVDIESLQENNNTVANPAVLYSSFKNEGTMRYHVTAPDGTCVIGGSSDCLVTKSTFGLRGDFKIVTIGGQTYLVRYSGPDSPLERFSITSIDPIVGQWKVGIDSQDSLLPQAQATNDVFMKIKYTANSTVETLQSQ